MSRPCDNDVAALSTPLIPLVLAWPMQTCGLLNGWCCSCGKFCTEAEHEEARRDA